MRKRAAAVDGCQVVPRQLFIELVRPVLERDDGEDLVALRVAVWGRKGNVERSVRFDLLDFYDRVHGITAMMRTTGYSLALTAVMQIEGRIREKGVRTPDECVPPDAYIEGMRTRGVKIRRSER
jgi:lysine 6-dehydrogenase